MTLPPLPAYVLAHARLTALDRKGRAVHEPYEFAGSRGPHPHHSDPLTAPQVRGWTTLTWMPAPSLDGGWEVTLYHLSTEAAEWIHPRTTTGVAAFLAEGWPDPTQTDSDRKQVSAYFRNPRVGEVSFFAGAHLFGETDNCRPTHCCDDQSIAMWE